MLLFSGWRLTLTAPLITLDGEEITMKVFISWSGETSRAIALLLRKYLPIMLQQVRPFMSKHDIESGSRWAQRIQQELEETSYGLLVLTPSNVNAKWVLFEAGAISKIKNSITACLLCRGLTDTQVSWPLAQFQMQRFEEESFAQLIRDMNNKIDQPLGEESMAVVIAKWWPDIRSEYDAILQGITEESGDHALDEKEFQEEVLRTLRALLKQTPSRSSRMIKEILARQDSSKRHGISIPSNARDIAINCLEAEGITAFTVVNEGAHIRIEFDASIEESERVQERLGKHDWP